VLARLHGLNPPPVERASVLDIGTSEGGNLIPLAVTLPDARFTGIDLAAAPLERGREVIAALNLQNIRLEQMDLMHAGDGLGKFDYIIAHGLYAWVPAAVRDKLLAVISANLSEDGIAFVSYNTFPGGHLRILARDLMLFHAERFEAPADRLKAARAMLDLVAAGCPEPDPIEQAVAYQARSALERTDSSLFHDYLAPVFEPVYFRDFVAHAARHRLGYVADASVADTYNMKLSPRALEAVKNAAGAGRIFQEQFLDLLRVRRFRRSLVCDDTRQSSSRWNHERAAGLYALSSAAETESGQFSGSGGMRVTLNEGAAALLRNLIAMWPASRPLQLDETELALELFRRDLLELRTLPSVATQAGETPRVSPLVRYQAARGDATVSTLHHRALTLEDAEGRRLLTILDGSRERDQLAREMNCSREQLDAQLSALAQHAVFLA
jgi:SAM-dependent methyltransferase